MTSDLIARITRIRAWLCRRIGHFYRVTHWSVDSATMTCIICGKRENI